jgi:hypothetical protein
VTLPIAAETQVGATPWLVIGWLALAVGIISALVIAVDVMRGYRQHMAIMNLVYPITGLYWGPIAVYFYFRRGRRMSPQWGREHGDGHRADDVLVADFVLAWTFGIAFQYSWLVKRGWKEKM